MEKNHLSWFILRLPPSAATWGCAKSHIDCAEKNDLRKRDLESQTIYIPLPFTSQCPEWVIIQATELAHWAARANKS